MNDCKFVAAQPRNEIRLSETTAEASGHGFQQLIADRMAECVVYALEMIKIEVQQRQVLALMNPLERLVELLAEQHPIGQVGERIVVRQVRDAVIRTLPLRYVLDHAEQILRFSASLTNEEPLCRNDAGTQGQRIEGMLVKKQISIGLHELVVMLRDRIGSCLRPDVVRSLADELVAPGAEIPFAGLVDQVRIVVCGRPLR